MCDCSVVKGCKMNLMKMLALAGLGIFGLGLRAGGLPPLYGDGVHDDTAAIQARLDSGLSCVYLPPPAKEYLISKALEMSSGQELRLDRFTTVRLAPNSGCPMVVNRHYKTGDRDIAVTGGRWEYDNVLQPSNKLLARLNKTYSRDVDRGCIFIFDKVDRLTVRGVTFANPVTYSCQLTRTTNFTVEDITFDFTKWNPKPINMDGIHLDGGCRHGRIVNLRGRCFDDMVAINANDGVCSAYEGEISDIEIDGLHAEQTHRGVRMLSTGAPIRNVSVRNVRISTYRNLVALTHFFPERKRRGVFENISICDSSVSAAPQPKELGGKWRPWPMVWVENGCDVGQLIIDGVCRYEKYSADDPTIGIEPGAKIEKLIIRNCSQVNGVGGNLVFLSQRGNVGTMELGSVSMRSDKGAGGCVLRHDVDDVYLLIGQSNMAGRGVLTPHNRVDTLRVRKWDEKRCEWIEAVEPIVTDRTYSGAGLGASFGRAMADADRTVIGLVPAADGGTPLARWMPGKDLYERAVDMTRAALASGGRLKGILWHQGCADAGSPDTATNYAARLVVMVRQLRKDLVAPDVPFVAGELGRFLKDFRGLDPKHPMPELLWRTVNEQIHQAVREIPNAAVVSSEGLASKSDILHFDTPSVRALGLRYADALKKIQSAKKP